MRTIDLDSLEIFRAVVAEGGVVRAATRLNRVQSNVTTRIRQLEERLGVALFHRQGRKLLLTGDGQRLLGYAERLLRLADEAVETLQGGEPRGRFRLGSLESTAGSRLPPVLARFHSLYPEVTVDLSTGPSGLLVERVRRFEIDAALVSEPFQAPDLQSQPVFSEELVLVAPQGATMTAATALARQTVIAFQRGCSYRHRLEEWLAGLSVQPQRVLEFASYQAMVACVAAGTGVTIVPRCVLAGLPGLAQVSVHPLPPTIAANRTHLIWQAPLSPAIGGILALLEVSPTVVTV
jgi:DNA-binding transcriptional LysR family regulator